jgi:hypothetical protein
MKMIAKPNGKANCLMITVDDAVRALLDGMPRRIIPTAADSFEGYVWELYRSIDTKSLRIRISDMSGRVHHFNSNEILIQKV